MSGCQDGGGADRDLHRCAPHPFRRPGTPYHHHALCRHETRACSVKKSRYRQIGTGLRATSRGPRQAVQWKLQRYQIAAQRQHLFPTRDLSMRFHFALLAFAMVLPFRLFAFLTCSSFLLRPEPGGRVDPRCKRGLAAVARARIATRPLTMPRSEPNFRRTIALSCRRRFGAGYSGPHRGPRAGLFDRSSRRDGEKSNERVLLSRCGLRCRGFWQLKYQSPYSIGLPRPRGRGASVTI